MQLSMTQKVPASRTQDRFSNLFQQGVLFLEDHRWNEAIHIFSALIKQNPTYKENGRSVQALLEQTKIEQQGYTALEQGDLQTALRFFRDTRNLEQIIEIEDAIHINELEVHINELENKGQYRQAAWVYDQLLRDFPKSPHHVTWEISKSECWHQELSPVFDEGVEAFEQKDWLGAKGAFTEVICGDPHFRRHNQLAAALLDQCTWEIRLEANKALENGRLQDALNGYEIIMDTQKMEQVKEFIYLRSKGEKVALKYEQEERWRKATAVYDWLLSLELGGSDKEKWEVARQTCATNAQLDRLFDDGVAAMESRNWQLASQKFSEIKQISPKFSKNGHRASKLNWTAIIRQRLPQFLAA